MEDPNGGLDITSDPWLPMKVVGRVWGRWKEFMYGEEAAGAMKPDIGAP